MFFHVLRGLLTCQRHMTQRLSLPLNSRWRGGKEQSMFDVISGCKRVYLSRSAGKRWLPEGTCMIPCHRNWALLWCGISTRRGAVARGQAIGQVEWLQGGKKQYKETDMISTRWIPSSTPIQRSHTNTHVTTELFRVPKDRTSCYHHACFWSEVIQWMNKVPSANNRQWPNVVLAFSASCDSSRASFVI